MPRKTSKITKDSKNSKQPSIKSSTPNAFSLVVRYLLGGVMMVFAVIFLLINWWTALLWLIAGLLILPAFANKIGKTNSLLASTLSLGAGLMIAIVIGKTTLPDAVASIVKNPETPKTASEQTANTNKPQQPSAQKSVVKLKKNQQIHCKIVKVADGDTATCLTDDKVQLKIRLWQIDAPENGQAFGKVAKRSLSDLIFGKYVMLKVHSQDRYGRTVAEIYLGQQNINKQMVKNGMAWAYREYLKDQEYISLETQAKRQKIGLWIDKNPIYPSQYRKQKPQNQTANQP